MDYLSWSVFVYPWRHLNRMRAPLDQAWWSIWTLLDRQSCRYSDFCLERGSVGSRVAHNYRVVGLASRHCRTALAEPAQIELVVLNLVIKTRGTRCRIVALSPSRQPTRKLDLPKARRACGWRLCHAFIGDELVEKVTAALIQSNRRPLGKVVRLRP